MLPISCHVSSLLLRPKDDLLDLHSIEKVVPLNGIRQGHDLVEHETVSVSTDSHI